MDKFIKIKKFLEDNRHKKNSIIMISLFTFIALIISIIISINVKYIVIENIIKEKQPQIIENLNYYSQLSAKEQLLYNEIISSAADIKRRTQLMPYRFTNREFQNVISAIIAENPRLFYLLEDKCELVINGRKTRVNLSYCTTPEQIRPMIRELDEKIESAREYADFTEGNFELEASIHDYLLNTTDDLTADVSPNDTLLYKTAYGALVLGKADSSGYADAFNLLMNSFGLFCTNVYGTAESNGQISRHVWNIVKIDKNYYHVDVTWDDANIKYAEDLRFHGYFNLSYAMISRDHMADNIDLLPLTDTDNTYYNHLGLYVKDSEALGSVVYSALTDALEKGHGYFEIYPSFTRNAEDLRGVIIEQIKAINQNGGINGIILKEEMRFFNASSVTNAVTVQIFTQK